MAKQEENKYFTKAVLTAGALGAGAAVLGNQMGLGTIQTAGLVGASNYVQLNKFDWPCVASAAVAYYILDMFELDVPGGQMVGQAVRGGLAGAWSCLLYQMMYDKLGIASYFDKPKTTT